MVDLARGLDLSVTAEGVETHSQVEFLAEVKNVFNTVQWSGATSVVATDALGNATLPIPAPGVVERGRASRRSSLSRRQW